MTGQMASEGTSRGRQRPSHHLKACLRGFQMVYRAHILCEELKLKIVATSKNFEAVQPLFQSEATRGHSSNLEPPRPPYMILKCLALISGCWIWPRPQMASGGLERPQKFKTEAKVKFDILRSGQGIWVSYTGGLGGLRSLEWPQAASDWKRGRTASKFLLFLILALHTK